MKDGADSVPLQILFALKETQPKMISIHIPSLSFMNVIAILFAFFPIAFSYREYIYIKALGRPEDMGKIFLHLGVSVAAIFLTCVTIEAPRVPSFIVPLISIIISYRTMNAAEFGVAMLVDKRYIEYRQWSRDLLIGPYQNKEYYSNPDACYGNVPAPVLPEELNLPLFWLETSFDEFFKLDLQFKDETALKAKEMHDKKLGKNSI